MPMMGPPPPGMMPVGPGKCGSGGVWTWGAAWPGLEEVWGRCSDSRSVVAGPGVPGALGSQRARWGRRAGRSADGRPRGPSWGSVSVRGYYIRVSSSSVLCEVGHKPALQLLIQLLYCSGLPAPLYNCSGKL